MGKLLKGFVLGRHTKTYLDKERKPQSGVYSDVDTLDGARKLTLLMKQLQDSCNSGDAI